MQVHDFVENEEHTAKTFHFASKNHLLLKQEVDLQRKQQGILQPLANILNQWLAKDELVAMACRSPRHALHLQELLSHYHIPIQT